MDYDSRYRKGYAYGKEPNEFLRDVAAVHLNASAPLDILSLGEGQGRNVTHLATLGHRCTACDQSAVGLSKTQALASERGVRPLVSILRADLREYDPRGKVPRWDAIISIFCALPAAARRRLHRACADSLRPGGLVVIECFAPRHASAATESGQAWSRSGPDTALLVGAAELRADFEGVLDVLSCEEVDRRVDEGRFHRGPAVVTQLIARRRAEGEAAPLHEATPPSEVGPPGVIAPSPLSEVASPRESVSPLEVASPSILAPSPPPPPPPLPPCPPPPLPYRLSMDRLFESWRTDDASVQVEAEAAVAATGEVEAAAAAAAAAGEWSAGACQLAEAAVIALAASPPPLHVDRLLSCAATSVRIARQAAIRHGVCRYCWVSKGGTGTSTSTSTDADPSGQLGAVGRAECLCAATDAAVAVARARASAASNGAHHGASLGAPPHDPPRVHWAFITHPIEWLRSTSTAKLAAQVLHHGGVCGADTSELLVYGAACDEARLAALLRPADGAPVHVLFPPPPTASAAEACTVEQALSDALSRRAACRASTAAMQRLGLSPEADRAAKAAASSHEPAGAAPAAPDESSGAAPAVPAAPSTPATLPPPDLTLLVPDGSWECARALVRVLAAAAAASSSSAAAAAASAATATSRSHNVD